jgi:hypothetical protein
MFVINKYFNYLSTINFKINWRDERALSLDLETNVQVEYCDRVLHSHPIILLEFLLAYSSVTVANSNSG